MARFFLWSSFDKINIEKETGGKANVEKENLCAGVSWRDGRQRGLPAGARTLWLDGMDHRHNRDRPVGDLGFSARQKEKDLKTSPFSFVRFKVRKTNP